MSFAETPARNQLFPELAGEPLESRAFGGVGREAQALSVGCDDWECGVFFISRSSARFVSFIARGLMYGAPNRCAARRSRIIIRRARALSDFGYEFLLVQMNRQLVPKIETFL